MAYNTTYINLTQTFSHTRQQIWSAAATKAQAHREKAENLARSAEVAEKNGDHATAAQLRKEAESERQQAKRWQWTGVAVNMVGAGLSVPTQSSAGIAANAAAPAASYVIGQEFKRRNAEGSLGHLLAHATLGGLTAAAGGNDPLTGALSSGGAEAAAGYISGRFGQTDGSRLSAEQKETVTAITGLIGTAAGAALGSTPADVAQGSLNAKNAVENNSQLFDDFGKWTTRKAAEAAQAARKAFPNTPAVSGFFLGLGDVFKGGLGLTDASLESLAMAIHCIGGFSYCNTAVANNQQRGRILLDVAKSVTDGRIKNALEHWGHNLRYGTPEQQRQATEQLARVATTLGVGSAVASPGVNPLYRPRLILRDGRIVTQGKAIPGNGSKLLTPPKALPKPTVEQGGGNRLPTRERVHGNTQETRKGNQSSQFRQHAQTEREVRTGAESRTMSSGGNTARKNVPVQRPKHPAHPDNAIGRNNRNYNSKLQQRVSNNNGTPTRSPNPLDNPNAQKIPTGKYPLTGQKPNAVLYHSETNGIVTNYATYDSNGIIIKRVDMTGRMHNEIETPHVLDYGRNYAPNGNIYPHPRRGKDAVRKPRPDELQYYKE